LVESKIGGIRERFEEESPEVKGEVREYGDDWEKSEEVSRRKSRLREEREVRKQVFRDSAQIDGKTR